MTKSKYMPFLAIALASVGLLAILLTLTLFQQFQETRFPAATVPTVVQLSQETRSPAAAAPTVVQLSQETRSPAANALTVVPTFHSLGIYWTPPGRSSNTTASVQYRPSGTSQWREGFSLWYSSQDNEYRGSLFHLTPDTEYEIQLTLQGGESTITTARTWSENFPIAETIELPEYSTGTLTISQSGSPDGYILYTHAPGATATIDGERLENYNIDVQASYVIVRDLTLKDPVESNIRLSPGAHHVVIEGNDISGWGAGSGTFGDTAGAINSDPDSSITNIIVQRNKFHDPATDTNSWGENDDGSKNSSGSNHPVGPQAVYMYNSGGNHVFRYNEVYSNNGNRYNDCFGGGANFSDEGFPNRDSDIYGNYLEKCWDNAIESEGANMNVRIWGNYITETYKPIATRDTNRGPLYIWRNVSNIVEKFPKEIFSWDEDPGGSFHKAGSDEGGDYGVFEFHNTVLQPTLPGVDRPVGAREGAEGSMENTTTRNNIFQAFCPDSCYSIDVSGNGNQNSFDYDLYNGLLDPSNAELNGIKDTPIYSGSGFDTSTYTGDFTLASNSPGYDDGIRLPNFNDNYTGRGPDMGAHEAGTSDMEFGVNAYLNGEPYSLPPGPTPTPDPNATPTPVPTLIPTPAPFQLEIEAEDMTITNTLTTGFDGSASGGAYVFAASGANTDNPTVEASTNFGVNSGMYYVWARLYGSSETTDASYVGVDGSWTRVYPSSPGIYEWVFVDSFELSTGNHPLQIGHGEVGARIDALYITGSSSDIPS